MTTYNIIYINNTDNNYSGHPPKKQFVWIEKHVKTNWSACIHVFSSKDAVIDSWVREYIKDEKLAKKRVVDWGHTMFLLDESGEIFRKATHKEVEN